MPQLMMSQASLVLPLWTDSAAHGCWFEELLLAQARSNAGQGCLQGRQLTDGEGKQCSKEALPLQGEGVALFLFHFYAEAVSHAAACQIQANTVCCSESNRLTAGLGLAGTSGDGLVHPLHRARSASAACLGLCPVVF